MCLAVPGKVIGIKGNTATLDYGSEKREADCSLMPCKIGEYVIVSNRMVIDKVDEKEAVASLKMYADATKKK
ncbi:MAG: HypC/HybG/HupF family hydrogenase formation chaperone [Candidatus Woesearchaeota archaeon]|nr:HypC/HybG/HupF family hydrogenase formation chaperone [Candidatus Woesearchaeota archaeon]